MTVGIRRAEESDAARLAELAALTFPLACPPDASAEDVAAFIAENLSAERFAEYVADAARVVLVAEAADGDDAGDAGILTGYAMLIFGAPHDDRVATQLTARPTAELSKIYVAPQHHGAGTAGALMASALEQAALGGASGVWLGTNQQNARAQRFYVKSGFERVGVKRFRLGNRWEDDYIFERVL